MTLFLILWKLSLIIFRIWCIIFPICVDAVIVWEKAGFHICLFEPRILRLVDFIVKNWFFQNQLFVFNWTSKHKVFFHSKWGQKLLLANIFLVPILIDRFAHLFQSVNLLLEKVNFILLQQKHIFNVTLCIWEAHRISCPFSLPITRLLRFEKTSSCWILCISWKGVPILLLIHIHIFIEIW